MTPSPQDVTRLLLDWKNGDREAGDALTPLVYAELRRLAANYLADERIALTLQPTALVNEAYIRLISQNVPDWECRSHFFGVAAQLMRQILVDHARRHRSAKRGSGVRNQPLEDAFQVGVPVDADLIALDDGLRALEAVDPRQAKIIELRFFGGLSIEETAQALGISVATVGRDQRMAEAFLYREINRT